MIRAHHKHRLPHSGAGPIPVPGRTRIPSPARIASSGTPYPPGGEADPRARHRCPGPSGEVEGSGGSPRTGIDHGVDRGTRGNHGKDVLLPLDPEIDEVGAGMLECV